MSTRNFWGRFQMQIVFYRNHTAPIRSRDLPHKLPKTGSLSIFSWRQQPRFPQRNRIPNHSRGESVQRVPLWRNSVALPLSSTRHCFFPFHVVTSLWIDLGTPLFSSGISSFGRALLEKTPVGRYACGARDRITTWGSVHGRLCIFWNCTVVRWVLPSERVGLVLSFVRDIGRNEAPQRPLVRRTGASRGLSV